MSQSDAARSPLCVVGIVADTHIPDRVATLHPDILPRLRAAGVNHILHAGDISSKRVLDDLRTVAQVTAVRGNRDFMAGTLKMQENLHLAGVEIALLHGHIGLFAYLWDKWKFWRFGYRLERYLGEIVALSGSARVVIFGHTHNAEILLCAGKMVINPGSASFGTRRGQPPSIGFLRIYAGGRVEASVTPLLGYTIINREWREKAA